MAETDSIHAFIDESGDTGFKFNMESSRYFCMAAVIFLDPADMDAVEQTIAQLRETLCLKKAYEFHFNKSGPEKRKIFCQQVRIHNFIIRAIIVDKMAVTDHELRKSSKRFYQLIARQLLEHSLSGIKGAKVVFDGKSSRSLKIYLRNELNKETRMVANVLFQDSASNSLIQLADIAASGIARSYQPEKGKDFDEYRHLLTRHIEEVHVYQDQTAKATPLPIGSP